MKKCFLSIFLVMSLIIFLYGTVQAQAYTFNIIQETVNVYWNDDGTASIDYVIEFSNDANGHVIDYVDLGLPNPDFDESSITADVNGVRVSDISRSGFQGSGPDVVSGVAIGLGSQSILPGSKGSFHAYIGKVRKLLQPDSQKGIASAVFSPAWFTTAHGETNLTVIFHFPKGVGEQDAIYHSLQPGWANQPQGYVDDNGMVTFTWNSPIVVMNHKIDFGASFPSNLIFAIPSVVPTALPAPFGANNQFDIVMAFFILSIFAGFIVWGVRANKHAVYNEAPSAGALEAPTVGDYQAPKITVEDSSIKRGLTAVEAAVLLKLPIEKILTMTLFSVIKKGAAQVTSNNPLQIKVINPFLNDLHKYETDFLQAFEKSTNEVVLEGLKNAMISLFQDVNRLMWRFDEQQTIGYYANIVQDAWAQVKAADTPEVTSQKLDQNLGWVLLDRDYVPRIEHLFADKMVVLPAWWLQFNPDSPHPASNSIPTPPITLPGSIGIGESSTGKINLPVLPGADFAASIVRSTQDLASTVIRDVTAFTQSITNEATPPPPPPTEPDAWNSDNSGGWFSPKTGHSFRPRSSGGGRHCACACAGGGR